MKNIPDATKVYTNLLHFLLRLNIDEAKGMEFIDQLKLIQLKKYEHFQMQGEPVKYMGYVMEGKFRYYRIDNEGNDRTLWFNSSFPFIGDYHSFLRKTSSELSIQAMNDHDLLLFNYDQMMEMFDTNAATQKLRTMLAERSMFGWRDIALSLHFDTAEERYHKLLTNHPNIEKEIPLKYIASCLGISPETLSRIRKKSRRNSLS